MAVTITIDGVDKTTTVTLASLNIQHALNARSTASIRLVDTAGTYRPDVGDPVTIVDDATTIFGGTVNEIDEYKPLGTDALDEAIQLVDYHELADRRVVAETYESQTAAAIVNDIITNYLAAEGISAGTVQTGPTITRVVYPYLPASQCLDELSKLTGFQWRINDDKTLDFFERATFTGTDITAASSIWDVRVRRHREGYRNRQYVRAGQGITDTQTDEKPAPKPDGVTRTFTMRYDVAKVPTITVDSGAQTVGIRGVDTDKQWYWQKGDKTITQDDGEAELSDANVLEVTYQGYYPIMAQSDDEAAQSERAAAEGAGSGIYEAVEDRMDIDDAQAASDVADGDLRRHASISAEVLFATDGSIYEPGQIINIVLGIHDIDGDYLVSEVNVTDRGRADEALTYSIRALSGEAVGGWAQFFKELVRNQKTFAIRENEVLVRNFRLQDTITLSEGYTVNVEGVTQTPDADLVTINVRGLTQTEDPSYTTYNAVGVTETFDAGLDTINLKGFTDPDEYNPSKPIWAVEGGGDAAGDVEAYLMTPVTTVGDDCLVGYCEVA